MNQDKLCRIIYYGLVFVVLFIALYKLITGPSEAIYGTDGEIEKDVQVGWALQMARILAGLVAAGAIGAFVLNIIRNFNESKGLIIGLVGMVIIVAIAYSMATPDLLDTVTQFEPTDADRALSKWSGAGLKTAFIVGCLTIVASIYFGIKNILS